MKTLEISLPSRGYASKKFFVLSDLHIATPKDVNKMKRIHEHILERMGETGVKYDAFFIVGDIIDSTDVLLQEDTTKDLIRFIAHLSSLAPVYIALGNHDLCSRKKTRYNQRRRWRKDERTFTREFLDRIVELPNTIVCETGTFSLDDYFTVSIFNPPLEYIMNSSDGNDRYLKKNEHLYKFLKKLNGLDTNILLCHYPNAVKFLHKAGYLKKIDLAITGHNHNGMTQFLCLESILERIGQPNRGIVTPGKSFKKEETLQMRGLVHMDKRTALYINPAVTSLAAGTGFLHYFDPLFYMGSTEVAFVGDEKKENE